MQGIKRWLHKLFAWWPWKQTPEQDSTQAVSNVNKGMAQEAMVRTVDGLPLPQPGATSVAVELQFQTQQRDSSLLFTDEHPTPTAEQKLAFLKYLINKGQINEGFEEEQTPEQYRKPESNR